MLTDFLKLFKADPADGNNTFNITTMLNDNWDKLNAWAKGVNATTLLSTTTGTAPNYLVAIPDLALTAGTRVTIKFHAATSAVATLKINNEVAYGIKKPDGTDFKNIKAGVYTLVFDGSNFTLQGEGASGNASASDLLSGKTASTDAGEITGTMPNIGSVGTQMLTTEAAEYTIPQGYHNGLGKVKAAITGLVASVIKAGVTVGGVAGTFTSDANATAAQILSGVTAYVNGNKVTGTIPSRGTATITPSTADQTIAAGQYLSGTQTIVGDPDLVAANILATKNIFGVQGSIPVRAGATQESPDFNMYPDGNLYLRPPAGYYDGATWVHWFDGDLVPGNVRAGLVIGNGVNFTGAMPDGTGLKRMASGTGVTSSTSFAINYTNGTEAPTRRKAEVSGLSFTPSTVILLVSPTLVVYRRDIISEYGSDILEMMGVVSQNFTTGNQTATYIEGANFGVWAGGFSLPSTNGYSAPFKWWAYE